MAGEKIFLVDDDADFVELNRMLLEDKGLTVFTASSASECREKVLDIMPDVIVLDVMMETEKAGIEAARWLREQEATKDIPIIMLTAVNQEYPFQFGPDEIWLPVDEFIEKPFPPERLLAEVRSKLSS